MNKVAKPFFGIPPSNTPNLLVLGIPWTHSSSFRECEKNSPDEMRNATSGLLYNSFSEQLFDLSEIFRFKDFGDIDTDERAFMEVGEEVSNIVTRNYTPDSIFAFLGGDHSISYLTVKAVKEAADEEFGLLYFDAHPDLYADYEGEKYSHACVVRRLIEENILDGPNIMQVGIRAPTKDQIKFAKEHGVKLLTASRISSISSTINWDLSKAYLSFDLDVLDPAYAPGVGNPEPGGLSTRTLVDVIHQINSTIVGFDVVEMCASYDYKGVTSFAAAKIIKEVLGRAAERFTEGKDFL
ncbi:MAG: agmatinase [Candidatus Korarchaeota archaeon]|nr:agmatinase [Candidatus Korarchaeota archaeon]NIU82913.1 agmatinase [Candidatus Thorarchaeota archaeon]NIW14179.1 agmatinase [Candidatus Thorarchaeota archaeon]NIW52287.1 agmatinase [Candidatus Korarchaeota archaeon]